MLKPTFLYYLISFAISTLFVLIIYFLGDELYTSPSEYDYYSLLIGGVGIIVSIILVLTVLLVGALLDYGIIACILAIHRGETVSFSTIFKKINGNIKNVFAVLGRIVLEGFIMLLISVLVFGIIFGVIDYILSAELGFIHLREIFSVIHWGIFMILVTITVTRLTITKVLSNYLIYDYPEKTSKEIVKKAKEIIKKQAMRYIILLLSIVWIIPFIAFQIVLDSSITEMIIWKPEIVSTGWSYEIVSTAPFWWPLLVVLLSYIMQAILLLKSYSYTASFYQSLSPERLFDEDFKIEKEKLRNLFIAVALIIVYILAILGIYNLWTDKSIDLLEARYSNAEIEDR